MTTEEAQELIAQINKYLANPIMDRFPSEDIAEGIEKIIARFANKPLFIIDLGEKWTCELSLKNHQIEFGIFRPDKVTSFKWYFTVEEIKQLRDNTIKMLDWLGEE